MKLIFLDVDGVLNHSDTPHDQFEEGCMKALQEIVKRTGAQIVLSSTWRYTLENTEKVRVALISAGIWSEEDSFIGHTCHLGCLNDIERFPVKDSHVSRTDEILLWLKCNGIPSNGTREEFTPLEESYNPLPSAITKGEDYFTKGEEWSTTGNWILESPVEVEQFVVLDDLSMLAEGCYGKRLKGHFIHTNLVTGLTMEMAEQAIKIFETKFNFRKWRKNVYKPCTNHTCLLNENRDAPRSQQTCVIA